MSRIRSPSESLVSFAMLKRSLDITSEVEFEGTLLRNGILSLNDEVKLANDYDENIRNTSDSMFDNKEFSISENLDELVEAKPPPKRPPNNLKLLQLEVTSHADCDYSFGNKTCLCFYKTSTPVRLEFNSQEELVIPDLAKKKTVRLQSTQDNLEELRDSDDLLEAALATSVASHVTCSPRVRQSLRRIKKSSKAGAITVLTAVLTNIV